MTRIRMTTTSTATTRTILSGKSARIYERLKMPRIKASLGAKRKWHLKLPRKISVQVLVIAPVWVLGLLIAVVLLSIASKHLLVNPDLIFVLVDPPYLLFNAGVKIEGVALIATIPISSHLMAMKSESIGYKDSKRKSQKESRNRHWSLKQTHQVSSTFLQKACYIFV